MTDLESEKQIVTLAGNLSLFGCFVTTASPFVTGTKVRLRITHRGTKYAAVGSVAYVSRYCARCERRVSGHAAGLRSILNSTTNKFGTMHAPATAIILILKGLAMICGEPSFLLRAECSENCSGVNQMPQELRLCATRSLPGPKSRSTGE